MGTGSARQCRSVTVYSGNRTWTVIHPFLNGHPSYALLLLITAPIPVVMVAATVNQGDSTFYYRAFGIVGLILLPISQRRLGWEIAWKPELVLVVVMYAIVCLPLGAMWLNEKRTIAAFVSTACERHRGVRGRLLGAARPWPRRQQLWRRAGCSWRCRLAARHSCRPIRWRCRILMTYGSRSQQRARGYRQSDRQRDRNPAQVERIRRKAFPERSARGDLRCCYPTPELL